MEAPLLELSVAYSIQTTTCLNRTQQATCAGTELTAVLGLLHVACGTMATACCMWYYAHRMLHVVLCQPHVACGTMPTACCMWYYAHRGSSRLSSPLRAGRGISVWHRTPAGNCSDVNRRSRQHDCTGTSVHGAQNDIGAARGTQRGAPTHTHS